MNLYLGHRIRKIALKNKDYKCNNFNLFVSRTQSTLGDYTFKPAGLSNFTEAGTLINLTLRKQGVGSYNCIIQTRINTTIKSLFNSDIIDFMFLKLEPSICKYLTTFPVRKLPTC